MKRFAYSLPLLGAVLLASACVDTLAPIAPGTKTPEVSAPGDPVALLAMTCTASARAGTMSCDSPASAGGANRDVIIGGQSQYVKLTSSNIVITGAEFAFDVTVTNLIPQPLGTTNGASADPNGIRVFFHSGPTSTGPGTVNVSNPDGTGTFTAAGQPYFQYAGPLKKDSISAVKRWKLQLTPDVVNFTFQVYVSTQVQYPAGYVDGMPWVLSLNPGESVTLQGMARSMVGNPLPDALAWSSSAPATAAVSGAQVTAGASRGFADLTVASGAKPGLFTTAVSVCPATVVTTGTSLPSAIANTDCFSTYGSSDGRPSTSYYADLYRVTLTAGQTITITLDSGDNLDTYLLLAGPTFGYLVAGNDDDDTGVLGVGSRVVYTATTTGVYVIEASTFNGADTGNYTLNVTIN